MNKINYIPFLTLVTDITSRYSKLNKEDYISNGNYRVIDQGQSFIGGFTNDKNLVTENKFPVIVFGDHTKIFKYVDFPFAIGADGVKVLMVNEQLAYPLYIYYYLKTIRLPEAGYSRHFKYLKNIKIPITSNITDQIRIATVLSKAEELIKQRKESITLLDELLKSTFLKMFGDPVRNEKGWDKVRLGDICNKIGSGATPRGGKENYKLDGIRLIRSLNVHNNQFEYENLAFIDDGQANLLSNVIVEQDDVLLNITGASVARCCIVPDNVLPARVNQHVAIIRPDDKILNPYFLNRLITTDRFQTFLVKNSKKKGATREAITKDEIEALNICVPPIDNQNRFTRIVEKVESLKAEYNNSLKEIENLYGSLSQRAFKGELNLSTIQVQLSKKEKPGINTTDLHAGIIAKIIYLHSLNPKHELTLGHVKAEKISHIIESHLNIDLGRNPKRIAAGPADFTHIKKVEHRAKMKNWFAVYKREGTSGYKYNLGKNYNNLLEITSNELGSREAEIDKIINLFLKQDSHQAEVVATTYAAWNDLLIEGKNPSDAEIIKEARLNWTESKLKISEDKFLKSIEWLRKKKLIPAGKGKHTIPTSDI